MAKLMGFETCRASSQVIIKPELISFDCYCDRYTDKRTKKKEWDKKIISVKLIISIFLD